MQVIKKANFSFAELNQNAADALLFLPELNFELQLYQQTLKALAETYHVIALAMPGSDGVGVPGVLTKEKLSAHVARHIEQFPCLEQKFAVFAHGSVACVLNSLLAQRGNSIQHIVLINPFVFRETLTDLILTDGQCCNYQIDAQAMDDQFRRQNFHAKFALPVRNYAEKLPFYAARESFDACMEEEFNEIKQFVYDRQVNFKVVFSDGCRNMQFDRVKALQICPRAIVIKGANFCFDQPEMAQIVQSVCGATTKSHINGDVEISI